MYNYDRLAASRRNNVKRDENIAATDAFIVRANDPRIRPLIPRDAIIRYYSQKARRVRRSAVSLRIFNRIQRRFTIMRDNKALSSVENNGG